jgi:hypothetical protein
MNRRAFLTGTVAVTAASTIAMPAPAIAETYGMSPLQSALPVLEDLATWRRLVLDAAERVLNPPWICDGDGPVRVWIEQANRDRDHVEHLIKLGERCGYIDLHGPVTGTECRARQAAAMHWTGPLDAR